MATSNFFYKNRCVAISNNNWENGNLPECECDYFGRNKMLLKRVLMFNITINIGYYTGGCIDYEIYPEYGILKKPCPVCGYKYGCDWKKVEVPTAVLEFLISLPDTEITPAWV